jgi:cytochrome c-type biogenesis protein CcmH/NrfG
MTEPDQQQRDPFWQQLGDRSANASIDETQTQRQRARIAAEFALGAPSAWRQYRATIVVAVVCLSFLGWSGWFVVSHYW